MPRANATKVQVELNDEDLKWFRQTYPKGSLAGVMSMLFEKFRLAHITTPDDAARTAADEFFEETRG